MFTLLKYFLLNELAIQRQKLERGLNDTLYCEKNIAYKKFNSFCFIEKKSFLGQRSRRTYSNALINTFLFINHFLRRKKNVKE